jgi:heterodisulfide reductase subunit A
MAKKKIKTNEDTVPLKGKKGKAVAVIGGGISGIQAALDLAAAGVKTYLIEKSPSIGGRMAQLDKTFPTMDCSI